MDSIIFALRLLHIREPLDGEGWPGQSRAGCVSFGAEIPAEDPSYPSIMSYKKGLFFFHVLYSIGKAKSVQS